MGMTSQQGGFADDLDWFRKAISGKFEVKFRARLGGDPGDDKRVRILNRVLEWTDGFGIVYEADQRHGELIIKELGLSAGGKSVSTPGVKEVSDESVDFNPSTYRALVARANYLAQDRPDIQYSVKELCRKMSSPDSESWMRLKRLGRYLVGEPRKRLEFRFQSFPEELHVWVDTDHAGCRETRKSTSGGVMMMGSHCLKSWSSTQSVVSLSSGESEYYGIVRGAAQGFGMRSMWDDLGISVKLVVNTDASAAKGIAMRKGLGKVRHIKVNQLWAQDRVQRGELEIRKISTNDTLADVLTKYVDRLLIDRHSSGMSLVSAGGRHVLAPVIAQVDRQRGAHVEGMSFDDLHGLVAKRTTSRTSSEGIPRPWEDVRVREECWTVWSSTTPSSSGSGSPVSRDFLQIGSAVGETSLQPFWLSDQGKDRSRFHGSGAGLANPGLTIAWESHLPGRLWGRDLVCPSQV